MQYLNQFSSQPTQKTKPPNISKFEKQLSAVHVADPLSGVLRKHKSGKKVINENQK